MSRSTITPDIEAINNPPDMKDVRSLVIIAIFAFGLFLFLSSSSPWRWVMIGVGVFLAIIFLYIAIERQFICRPRQVRIREDGLILYMRFGRGIKFVRYDQIKWIDVADDDPAFTHGRSGPDGYIGLGPRNMDIFPMKWPIAIQVRGAYKNKMGRLPGMKNHGWEIESQEISLPFYCQARMRASTKVVCAFFTIISGILVILGLLAYGPGIWMILLFVIGTAVATSMVALYVDYYQFPKAVNIDLTGVTLYRWLLRDEHIEWPRIADVYVARKYALIATSEPRKFCRLSKEAGHMVLEIAKQKGIIN